MKKLLAIVLCLSLMVLPTYAIKGEVVNPDDLPYIPPTESTPSDWAKDEIQQAKQEGLVPEISGNPFYTTPITRIQFAELVVNMVEKILDKEITAAPDTTFTDTTNQSVLKAYESGIVNGVGEDKFEPNNTTNRQEIASMLYRAMDYIAVNQGSHLVDIDVNLDAYTDGSTVSDWAKISVGYLASEGIMKGTSDTELSPMESCTVEQSILLIYRIYKQLNF